jgi:hypothetical protein
MAKCKATPSAICADYDAWFSKSLWAPVDSPSTATSWFDDVDQKFRAAFPKFRRCLRQLPSTLSAPAPLGCTSVSTALDLHKTLRRVVQSIQGWADKVTDASDCVTAALPTTCSDHSNIQDLMVMLREAARAVSDLPFSSSTCPSSAERVCQRYLKWSTDFYQWGAALSVWENAAFSCAKSGSLQPDQITPPPWPPWTDIDTSSGDKKAVSTLTPESLEALTVRLLNEVDAVSKASTNGGIKIFPNGITSITAKLDVANAFEIDITLTGP